MGSRGVRVGAEERESRGVGSGAVRVLICPDKFAGSLSAPAAAAAIAAGWSAARPDDELVLRPLADGGPGFLDALRDALPAARTIPVPTVDPLGRPVPGWILVADGVAYVESAQACGLHLLDEAERDPATTTSYGLGRLVAAGVGAGAGEVVIGLGGSATNDGGAGMLAALGAAPLDAAGRPLPPGGAALVDCARLAGAPALAGVRLVAATDVDSPLVGPAGASAVFGPQKGATPDQVDLLDRALAAFAGVLGRELPGCPPDLAHAPGGGAAGGLGAAVLAAGGRCESGFAVVRRLTGLDQALDACDIAITGEGKFDSQSARGKAVAGVAGATRERGVPCLVLAGRVELDRAAAAELGVSEAASLVAHFGSVAEAMARPAEGLGALAGALARRWHRPDPAGSA